MERNKTIDIAKFVAALLVIAIHTKLFAELNDFSYFIFNKLICRLAVPFFALCTGYYVSIGSFKRQWLKQLRIYSLWTLVYFIFLLPNWISSNLFSGHNIIGFGKSALLAGSYFHLWYILYIIYTLPVFYLIKKNISPKYWIIIGVTLWGTYAAGYGYNTLLPKSLLLIENALESGYAPVISQFVLLPFLLVGAFIQTFQIPSKGVCGVFSVLAFALLVLEADFVKSLNHQEFSRIFMILPASAFIFMFLLNIRISAKLVKGQGNMSLIIYCVHPMFCRILEETAMSTTIRFVTIATLSILFAKALAVLQASYHNRLTQH